VRDIPSRSANSVSKWFEPAGNAPEKINARSSSTATAELLLDLGGFAAII